MKRYIGITVISILALSIWGCKSSLTSPVPVKKDLSSADKSIVSSSKLFGLKLFKQVNEAAGDSNIFISPLSVSTAFGMVLNGANGQTYDEIKSTLELTGANQDDINKGYQNLNQLLTEIDPKVIFQSANSIWYRQEVSFEQSFLDVNKNYFDAEVQGLDFNNPASTGIINNWVSERTNGKITSIIKKIPKDAVMYLINAIYFYGTWKYQFDSTATKQDDFYITQSDPVKCMMMNQKNKLNYYQANNYQAVELPYGDGDFSMLLILPSQSGDINSFIDNMDGNFWNNLLTNMDSAEVNLWLPRFKLEYSITLNDALKAMGMESAFNPLTADFTKMRKERDLFISRVLHKTFIDVNEKGTEAAAVTAIEVGISAVVVPSDKIFMRVNHPFIFAIREKTSGAILFIGKVVNPAD